MKKRNIKKKVGKRRNPKPDHTPKLMAESSKQVTTPLDLALAPQQPLQSQQDFRLIARDE